MVSKYKVGDVVTARAGFNDNSSMPETTFTVERTGPRKISYHNPGDGGHECQVIYWSRETVSPGNVRERYVGVWECFIIDKEEPLPVPNDSEPVITKKEVYAHVNPLLPDVTHWELGTLPPTNSEWWDNNYTSPYGSKPAKHTDCKRVNIQKYTIEYRTEVKP